MLSEGHDSGGAEVVHSGAVLGGQIFEFSQARTPILQSSVEVSGCKTASAAALRGLNPLLAIQPGGHNTSLGSKVRGSGPIFQGCERM